jgi:hypothetical protein
VLKINSEVATDNDKEEFLEILKTGIVTKSQKSNYAKNYLFFQEKIEKFLLRFPSYFAHFPVRILGNCILLPIEAESQDTALRIFSTLNDRGMPLSDADIFKAQFYKYYNDKGEKDNFILQWKEIEEVCDEIFHPITGSPMDELFARYMYFERAKEGNKSSTTEALRKFYERGKYRLLKSEETFDNLKILADFWRDVSNQNSERFSTDTIRKLYVLKYAPNGMWHYFVSVYFMHNKDTDGKLDDEKFEIFLSKIIAFIWTYAITNPGVNALRTPVYAEMVNIVNNVPVEFKGNIFDSSSLKNQIDNYTFNNNRPITRSMLTWWAFNGKTQTLPTLDTIFEIEHIFSKNRQKMDRTLINEKNLESLGNKSLFEKRINIRASDYRFSDKKEYYQGLKNIKGQNKECTCINELIELSQNNNDFAEKEIEDRFRRMIDGFVEFLAENGLLK